MFLVSQFDWDCEVISSSLNHDLSLNFLDCGRAFEPAFFFSSPGKYGTKMGLFAKKAQDASSSIQFLHDQEGPMERLIMGKLSEFFHDIPQLEEAFFARVMYSGNVQGVSLCVYGSPEMDTQLVLKGISQVYSRVVKTETSLHTIFLTPAQHVDIMKVCKAFYRSSALK